jgi:hypothetical protein
MTAKQEISFSDPYLLAEFNAMFPHTPFLGNVHIHNGLFTLYK